MTVNGRPVKQPPNPDPFRGPFLGVLCADCAEAAKTDVSSLRLRFPPFPEDACAACSKATGTDGVPLSVTARMGLKSYPLDKAVAAVHQSIHDAQGDACAHSDVTGTPRPALSTAALALRLLEDVRRLEAASVPKKRPGFVQQGPLGAAWEELTRATPDAGEEQRERALCALIDAGFVYEPVLSRLKVVPEANPPTEPLRAACACGWFEDVLTEAAKAAAWKRHGEGRRCEALEPGAPAPEWPDPRSYKTEPDPRLAMVPDPAPWPDPMAPHPWPRDMLTVSDCWPGKGDGFTYGTDPTMVDAESGEPLRPAPVKVRFTGRVRGFLGESGLRATCPDCQRFLMIGECRLHGKVKGRWVLKVKCRVALKAMEVLEDGPGKDLWTGRDGDDTALLVLWGAATMGKLRNPDERMALKQAWVWAHEAMDPRVVGEIVEADLMVKGARIEGEGWLVPVNDSVTGEQGWCLVVGEAFTATTEELRK